MRNQIQILVIEFIVSYGGLLLLFYFSHDDPQALDTCRSVISNDRTLISTKGKTIEAGDRSLGKNRVNAVVIKRVISLTRQRFGNL